MCHDAEVEDPTPIGRSAMTHHVLADTGFADVDAEFEVHPQRILAAQPPDQVADFL
jgi:hypothetical protein